MGNKKKKQMEFRYYEIPYGEPVLALMGEHWNRSYGLDENRQPITDLHFHNLMEIGCCYHGEGELLLENERFPFSGGMISVIPENYPHTTTSRSGKNSQWEYLFLDVPQTVRELFGEDRRMSDWILSRCAKGAFCKSRRDAPVLFHLAVMIFREMEEKRERYQEAVRGLLKAFLIEAARNQESGEKKNGNGDGIRKLPAGGLGETRHISAALEYIHLHYGEPVRIGELAAACHLSEPHFRRLFVQCMGMPPLDYLNHVRIEKACERMKKGDGSIAGAAAHSGFSSAATFQRNFRRIMGISPKEWKKSPENYQGRLAQYRITYYDGWE